MPTSERVVVVAKAGVRTRAAALVAAALMAGAVAGCGVDSSSEAPADYPDRSITLIAPFEVGGTTDVATRKLAALAEKELGQSVKVVNRGGAGGAVGHTEIANAKPDGHTIGVGSSDSLAQTPHLTDVGYSFDDFTGWIGLYDSPFMIMVRGDSKWRTIEDLEREADSGKRLKYGHSGAGFQFALAEFFERAVIEATGVPFDGGAKALTALLAGDVDVIAQGGVATVKQVESGQSRALGVFGSEPFSALPKIPTLADRGYEGTGAPTVKAIVAPAGTPDEIVATLTDAFTSAVESPEWQEFMKTNGLRKTDATGDPLRELLEEEFERSRETFESAGFKGAQ